MGHPNDELGVRLQNDVALKYSFEVAVSISWSPHDIFVRSNFSLGITNSKKNAIWYKYNFLTNPPMDFFYYQYALLGPDGIEVLKSSTLKVSLQRLYINKLVCQGFFLWW